MKEEVAFCLRCGRPTPLATVEQVTEWELEQWRRHARPDAQAQAGTTPSPGAVVAPAATRVVAERLPEPVSSRNPVTTAPRRGPSRRSPIAGLASRISSKRTATGRVAPSDPDSEFHYTACTSCERTDWIIRTGRNEDGSWRYWCVRCSRSFKTDALLRHGAKPFVAGGSILAVLGVLANVL